MKHITAILSVFVVLLILSPIPLAAQPPSCRGRVQWANGVPAIGLEVKIVQGSRELAKTFTNEKGLYAFFSLQQPLVNFSIIVSDRNRVLGRTEVSRVGADGRVADIIVQ